MMREIFIASELSLTHLKRKSRNTVVRRKNRATNIPKAKVSELSIEVQHF